MNESITRAAGGVHGQELDAAQLQALARRMGRASPAAKHAVRVAPGEATPIVGDQRAVRDRPRAALDV